jgi:hypothetical protein
MALHRWAPTAPLHREPRNLMTKLQRHAIDREQAGRQELIDRRCCATGDRIQQRKLDPGADQGRRVQHPPRVAAQPRGPGQHRVPRGLWHLAHPGLHGLADVERVAAGQLVQRGGIEAAPISQHRHRARGERREADAPEAPPRGQVAQRDLERIRGAGPHPGRSPAAGPGCP